MTAPTQPVQRYRVIAISHDQCVNPHGVSAIPDEAGVLCYYSDAEREWQKWIDQNERVMAIHSADRKYLEELKSERDTLLQSYKEMERRVGEVAKALEEARAAQFRAEGSRSADTILLIEQRTRASIAEAERDAARSALIDCQAKELRAVKHSTEMESRYYDEMARTCRAEAERDLAIAHDRQPYPTAAAYEAVCAALEKTKAERDSLSRKVGVYEKALRDVREYVDNGDLNKPPCLRDRITLGDGREAHEDLDEILEIIDSALSASPSESDG